jgi:hypothetical protein
MTKLEMKNFLHALEQPTTRIMRMLQHVHRQVLHTLGKQEEKTPGFPIYY